MNEENEKLAELYKMVGRDVARLNKDTLSGVLAAFHHRYADRRDILKAATNKSWLVYFFKQEAKLCLSKLKRQSGGKKVYRDLMRWRLAPDRLYRFCFNNVAKGFAEEASVILLKKMRLEDR